MRGPERDAPDPQIVFHEDYWGDTLEFPPTLPRLSTSRAKLERSQTLMLDIVPRIVAGELRGPVITQGQSNPSDPELARSSPHNMPGCVLLVDLEFLRPLDSYPEGDSRSFECDERSGQPSDQPASTRVILQHTKFIALKQPHYHAGLIDYSNDTYRYHRSVRITQLFPAKGGISTARDVLDCIVPQPGVKSDGKRLVTLAPFSELCYDIHIGQSYLRTDYSKHSPSELSGFLRLRSLEICLPGEPPLSSQEKLPRGLGWLASGFLSSDYND
jgi:hypothetical protein